MLNILVLNFMHFVVICSKRSGTSKNEDMKVKFLVGEKFYEFLYEG